MPDELTLGELGRRLGVIHDDLKEDLRVLSDRVDGKVSEQVLALQQQAQDERHRTLVEKVKALETAREADAKALRETRRWLIASVIIPILGTLLPLLITKGAL